MARFFYRFGGIFAVIAGVEGTLLLINANLSWSLVVFNVAGAVIAVSIGAFIEAITQ